MIPIIRRAWVSIVREITQRKEIEADLETRASTDSLTGLANRRAFDLAVKRALDRNVEGCLAIFDLDRFKAINDRFGHATGDLVLQRFTQVLCSTVRSGDVLGRFGGEEFVAFFDRTSIEQAEIVCERVRQRFEGCHVRTTTGALVNATVSVGLAPINNGIPMTEIFDLADRALYRSKSNGRNRLTLAA